MNEICQLAKPVSYSRLRISRMQQEFLTGAYPGDSCIVYIKQEAICGYDRATPQTATR